MGVPRAAPRGAPRPLLSETHRLFYTHNMHLQCGECDGTRWLGLERYTDDTEAGRGGDRKSKSTHCSEYAESDPVLVVSVYVKEFYIR